jgi:choline kinase
MKVIILSAGQGTRLLPLTAKIPKCLLEIQGKTILEWQIGELHKCGIDQITVVTGYGADKVDDLIQQRYLGQNIKSHYNPDFATTDNLVSCWKVREEMNEDFILLNGDTLFEAAVVRSLLASPVNPVTVTVNHADSYDADDMKVSLSDTRLVNISKELPADKVHGESIGMILFRGDGPVMFRKGLQSALNDTTTVCRWYLSVIDTLAQEETVLTCSIRGLVWCEVDYVIDLKKADRVVADFSAENRFDTISQDSERQKATAR